METFDCRLRHGFAESCSGDWRLPQQGGWGGGGGGRNGQQHMQKQSLAELGPYPAEVLPIMKQVCLMAAFGCWARLELLPEVPAQGSSPLLEEADPTPSFTPVV